MTDHRENYIAWLRDAHAMEEQALSMMRAQASRIESYPDLNARIRQHIEETERQEADLRRLLERGDENGPSVLKDMMGKVAATGQAMGGIFASDEIVKGSMASYTFEHMEIASYLSLIAAAETVGDHEAIAVFERNLAEEVQMADWLRDHLGPTTQQFLHRSSAELQAKR